MSPCAKCLEPIADRYDRECTECKPRADYAASYGGMFASVPDQLCDYRRFVANQHPAGSGV